MKTFLGLCFALKFSVFFFREREKMNGKQGSRMVNIRGRERLMFLINEFSFIFLIMSV